MEGFTKEVRECASRRTDALSAVSASTQQLLSAARAFMPRVSQEQKDRAAQVRSSLNDNLRKRQDHVRALRHQFQEHFGKMREQLHEMLGQDRQACHTKVAELKTAFGGARTELVNDLRESARIWHSRSHPGHQAPVQPRAEQQGPASPVTPTTWQAPAPPVTPTTWQAPNHGADAEGGEFQ